MNNDETKPAPSVQDGKLHISHAQYTILMAFLREHRATLGSAEAWRRGLRAQGTPDEQIDQLTNQSHLVLT